MKFYQNGSLNILPDLTKELSSLDVSDFGDQNSLREADQSSLRQDKNLFTQTSFEKTDDILRLGEHRLDNLLKNMVEEHTPVSKTSNNAQ